MAIYFVSQQILYFSKFDLSHSQSVAAVSACNLTTFTTVELETWLSHRQHTIVAVIVLPCSVLYNTQQLCES